MKTGESISEEDLKLIELWSIKNKHSDKLTLEEAKFIFSQAEKSLEQTVEITKLITNRATSLLTITLGILLVIIGYIIKAFLVSNYFCLYDSSIAIGIITTIYLLSIVYLLSINLKSHFYFGLGTRPNESFQKEIFKSRFDKKNFRLMELYLTEIEDYEKRICLNDKKNGKRWKQYDRALMMLIFSPGVLLISSLIIFLLN